MNDYASQLAALSRAVMEWDIAPCLPLIKGTQSMPPQARLAVYRHAYCQRLLSVTYDDFPATAHAMGEHVFRSHVQSYVQQHISDHWDINRYGLALPDWLNAQGCDISAVALAYLEAAIAQVFWLPDSPVMQPQAYCALVPETLAVTRIAPRDACVLLALDANPLAYLEGFRAGETHVAIEAGPCYVAVWRHENTVQRTALAYAEYRLLTQMQTTTGFAAAVDATLADGTISEDALLTRLGNDMLRWLGLGLLQAHE
jgi:hypothetical protein